MSQTLRLHRDVPLAPAENGANASRLYSSRNRSGSKAFGFFQYRAVGEVLAGSTL